MMKKSVPIAAMIMLTCADTATGSIFDANGSLSNADFMPPATATWVYTIDISGFSTIDALGDPDNLFFTILNIAKDPDSPPPENAIIGIGWDLTITTISPSWASEATISFGGELNLPPAAGDDFSVTDAHYSSGGIVSLPDADLSPIAFADDNMIRVEFFESFDDTDGLPEAIFAPGSTLTICTTHVVDILVPAPGCTTLLALAGYTASRRKRSCSV